ncbi:MAG: hypothetical protein ACP5KW_07725 [Thermoproteota archaeon]
MNVNSRKLFLTFIVFMAILSLASVYFLSKYLNKKVGLENLALVYKSYDSLICVEYKPGFIATFFRNPKIHLTVTPVGKNKEVVRLNFTLKINGDAILGKWPNRTYNLSELEADAMKQPSSYLLKNISKNFNYSKSVVVSYDLKSRSAYLNGSNIGILPFGITETNNITVASVWLQNINSIEVNTTTPPNVAVKAVVIGNSTFDFSNGTAKIMLKVPPGVVNETMISKISGLTIVKKLQKYWIVSKMEKIDTSSLPPAYKELIEIFRTRKLEFYILSNASKDYPENLLSFIQVEKSSGIPFNFVLAGGPKLIVKGGNYTFNGKVIKSFPVMPLAYFLGIRNSDISFYLIDVKSL